MAITRYFTVDDLANFPDDGNRYEVIEGELYVSAAPRLEHQAVCDNVIVALAMWDPDHRHGLALSGVGLIFSIENGVIPDLVWVSAERAAVVLIDPKTGRRDGKLHAAPDLVVEVLSPGRENEERDRQTKMTLYSRRGVKEYWIVDRLSQTVEVYRRGELAQLELIVTLTAHDQLTSPQLPAFGLPVEQIFRLPEWLPA